MKTSLNSLLRAVIGLIATVIVAGSASAHVVTEVPWHPVAGSYRTILFLSNLKPVPWQKIQEAFEKPLPAASGSKTAVQKLLELGNNDVNDLTKKIAGAISNQDRQALYASTTRALSRSLRHHLDLAASGLDNPSEAARHVKEAQLLYRAFGEFIRQTDAAGYKGLGRAWLALTNSLGATGIAGLARRDPDKGAFKTAHQTIATYLRANFEPIKFARREKLVPVPEHVAANGIEPKVAHWLPPGSNLNDQDPLPRLVLNFEERGIDEKDVPLIAYGDMLFDSPVIFGEPARSLGVACSTCHNRSDINRSFFIPGISHQAGALDVDGEFFNSSFNDRRSDSLDIPSLRGLRFTGPYGRDGRFGSLRDFTRNVIVNEFGGKEPTPFMLDALVAYLLEFDFLPNSKVGRSGRLTAEASEGARRGEKLFRKTFDQMDGKSCASCHIPSANFLDRRTHNIGSAGDSYDGSRDAAYDTPTLLGSKFTAPYFHDGSLPTLASVVDWFNDQFALELGAKERGDLTAYLEAVGGADEPFEIYKGKHTPFRLAFEELTTFASTLDKLLPDRDAYHAKLMIDTVAPDLSADASGMANLPAKPRVYELANLLAEVGRAIDRKDWPGAEHLWKEFKRLEERYNASMY